MLDKMRKSSCTVVSAGPRDCQTKQSSVEAAGTQQATGGQLALMLVVKRPQNTRLSHLLDFRLCVHVFEQRPPPAALGLRGAHELVSLEPVHLCRAFFDSGNLFLMCLPCR